MLGLKLRAERVCDPLNVKAEERKAISLLRVHRPSGRTLVSKLELLGEGLLAVDVGVVEKSSNRWGWPTFVNSPDAELWSLLAVMQLLRQLVDALGPQSNLNIR